MALKQKSDLARRAEKLIPGGVNSPVRAMRSVGLDEPVFVRSGSGSTIEDVERLPLRTKTGSSRPTLRQVDSAGVQLLGPARQIQLLLQSHCASSFAQYVKIRSAPARLIAVSDSSAAALVDPAAPRRPP